MKSARSLAVIAVVATVAVWFFGVRPRLRAGPASAATDGRIAVNVVVARRDSAPVEFELPATLQASQDTPIYARTGGYLGKYLADLGDRVKAGQVLAILDAPELEQNLNQARASLDQARAGLELARISAARWSGLGAEHAVAQQAVDEKEADLAARQADVLAAEANVKRLAQLKDYLVITAPFDGVISARNYDLGALITAGAGREIFHLVQTDPLRVYADVPQSAVRSIRVGLPAEVLVPEFPQKVFAGKIIRFAGALDPVSRTLLTEVQIPNPDSALLSGMFCQVRFRAPVAEPPLVIPSNAVIINADGVRVATVTADDHLHFQTVKLGRDFGTRVEILDGLAEGARVVANPRDSLTEGTAVEPVPAATETGKNE